MTEPKYFFQRMDGILLLSFMASEAEVISVAKDFGYKLAKPFNPSVNIDGHINYFGYVWKDIHKQAESIIKKIESDPSFLTKVENMWRVRVQKLQRFEKEISNLPSRKIFDSDLVKIFNKLIKLYQEEYSPGLLCDSFGLHTESIIASKLQNIIRKRKKAGESANYLEVLTAAPVHSFATQEEISLLRLAKEIKKNKKIVYSFKKGIKGTIKIIKEDQKILRLLSSHISRFFWIENSYAKGVRLDEIYFLKRIRKYTADRINLNKEINKLENLPKKHRRQKKLLIKKLRPDKKFKEMIKWIEFFGWLHDARKGVMMEAHYYIALLLKEIGRRLELSLQEMYYIDYHKIKEILLSKKFDRKLIRRRMKLCAYLIWPHQYKIVVGSEAQRWEKELHKYEQIFSGELQGVSASAGRAFGRVRIVKSIKDGSKLKKGDILVTGMTRPHWMTFIKKARAIVTEEGGITCHAAIVSRELGIPCVIGTKIATQALKDGDRVEVDATKGIVKKL